MNSTLGNFTPLGERIMTNRTPEDTIVVLHPMYGRVVCTFDALNAAYVLPSGFMNMVDTAHGERSGACFAQERAEVSDTEIGRLTALCRVMLHNGATLYELQQRIMGF